MFTVQYKLGPLEATDEYPDIISALARVEELLRFMAGITVTIHRVEEA